MIMDENISQKTKRNKETLLENLRKTPIVQVACEKTGVARATYYRWRKEDEKFAEESDEALYSGKKIVNDMAESQLMKAVRDGNMTGIIFWLKNNHPDYKTKVEVTGRLENSNKLTSEEEIEIHEALIHAGLLPTNPQNDGTNQ
jgi:hypothetical protein